MKKTIIDKPLLDVSLHLTLHPDNCLQVVLFHRNRPMGLEVDVVDFLTLKFASITCVMSVEVTELSKYLSIIKDELHTIIDEYGSVVSYFN